MNSLQNSGQPVANIISKVAEENGMHETPNLLHQGTFLQFAYTCSVWLWESAKIEKFEEQLLKKLPVVADRFGLQLPC
ncbi:MAG: hypothetical protein U5J62_11200 [Desulfurivibrio sp.]|nr:hypothetical protein [Desulfurivibrio sp.]